MITRLCLLPPDLALALSPARVQRLRRSYDGLRGFDETDPLAVARAVSFRELPVRTTELFHSAVYLATDDGREATHEAARGRRDLAPWLLLTAMDLAIDVARAAEAGDSAALVLQARARASAERFLAPRVEYDLFATRGEMPGRLDAIVECGREMYKEQFVDGWLVECEGAALRAVIVHEGHRAAMARSKRGEGGAERRARRPLGCDTIRWDAVGGRVGLTLAKASRLPEWREKLGLACAGDEGFFLYRVGVGVVKG